MTVIDIEEEASLAELIGEHDIVVIDFWAPWCRPCLGFHPIFVKVAEANRDLVFCRVDTTRHAGLRSVFEVESIPTLVVVRDRVLVASQTGNLTGHVVESILEQVRCLDMDEVRRDAEAEAARAAGAPDRDRTS